MRTLLAILTLTLVSTLAMAQRGVENPVSLEARVEPTTITPGEPFELIITATVDSEYHLYAMTQPPAPPDSFGGPQETTITLASEEIFLDSDWVEPEVTTKFDQGFQMDVNTLYGSPLEFRRTLTIATPISPGETILEGRFRSQACTEVSCLPPARQSFSVPVTIAEATAPLPERPEPSEVPTVGGVGEQIDSLSFGGFLLTSFLFGLLALLTPCVFPMIPITISFFADKQSESRGRAVRRSLIYVISIVLGFTVIGFGISLILLALGGGVQSSGFAQAMASNPWINLFFFLLYTFFALALFEVIRLRLPSGLANSLDRKGGSEWLSIASKAMVFVVISFTCTAPLLGVLIVQTLAGEWTRPLFGMMAFSTGFALPFFFLALAPQMIGHLPRAGSWMHSIKFVMGMLVFAAALKFLSNSDIIWLREDMVLTREVLLSLWAAIALTLALYLFGFIKLEMDSGERAIGHLRLSLAVIFAAMTLYLGAGLTGAPLHGWVEAYLPPNLKQSSAGVAHGEALPASRMATGGDYIAAGYSWYEDVEEAMDAAREQGRNVFIDFTGYTCTNCRLMEQNMFPRPEVAPLLEEYVRLKLYTDDPDIGEQHREYQAEMFNTITLPFYAILTPEGEVLGKAEYTTNVQAYVDFLNRGRG